MASKKGYRASATSGRRLRLTNRRTLLLSRKKRAKKEAVKAVPLPSPKKVAALLRKEQRDRDGALAVLSIASTAITRARGYLDTLQRELEIAIFQLQPKKSTRQSSRRKA